MFSPRVDPSQTLNHFCCLFWIPSSLKLFFPWRCRNQNQTKIQMPFPNQPYKLGRENGDHLTKMWFFWLTQKFESILFKSPFHLLNHTFNSILLSPLAHYLKYYPKFCIVTCLIYSYGVLLTYSEYPIWSVHLEIKSWEKEMLQTQTPVLQDSLDHWLISNGLLDNLVSIILCQEFNENHKGSTIIKQYNYLWKTW